MDVKHQVGSGDPPARGLRADARRNAGRLLAAAREVFAEEGPGASLEEVARRAGVGIGTLYRHFPNRQALVEAALRDTLEASCAESEQLLHAPDPGEALTTWLRAQMTQAYTCRGLAAEAMITMLDQCDGGRPTACDALRDVGARLLLRAQVAGRVRAGVDIDDLLRLVNAIVLTTEGAPDRDAQAGRMFTLLIDGVRAQV
jgi:AcrR family transcriptional regulator